MRFLRSVAVAGILLLSACMSATLPANRPVALSVQSNAGLRGQFSLKPDLPAAQLTALTRQAQDYADEVSRRRGIDFFRLHPNPVGIKLTVGNDSSFVLSFLGTSKDRNDLNLELRTLGTGSPGMSLNYSGPVTLSRNNLQAESRQAAVGTFGFELVTGLPGQGVTEAYEAYMEGLGEYLRARYQARPFAFDDGPLVYAIHYGGALQGFVFLNQGNRLILGERKYADVQSVALFSPQRKLLAAYTLIGFNPKTTQAEVDPVWQSESDARFGSLVQFGEL